ncbi:membrane protein insertase YidC [Azospirillum rugosum]|uniref:Membrane protein insertase YidC n=1 Tax=Azospirillum rugosum TaxID=416170 RepID=A0ABS4SIH9_9PROT|nr:membrane protein insertase YidC [Azospirillum rugosum]MBP2292280.1 YidC/Oxa1 family membrane protein insertase [Azospirillum rugosum]MDQ0526039.1 YidC/Oxa1 family membrane protein insertase [Azospirillum rugosum]
MTDQRNLILAIALSIAILLGFQYFYEGPRVQQQKQAAQQAAQTEQPVAPGTAPGVPGATVPGAAAPEAVKDRAALIAEQMAAGSRVKIDTPALHGSVNLVGARIDDLTLADYHETTDPKSPEIVLLAPGGTPDAYYAEFGWVPEDKGQPVPGADTKWTANGQALTPDKPLTLTWDNGKGLVFERTIAVDKNFMFTVTQKVRNTGSAPVRLLPYSLVSRAGTPQTSGYYILHEGPLGVFNGKLNEHKYDDLKKSGSISAPTTGGWIGITDKYWLVSLVPDQKEQVTARFLHTSPGATDRYQVDTLGQAIEVAPGATAEQTSRLFAGAKQVRLLDEYSDKLGIANFDLAIDFGWFYFLTKPFFYALDMLGRLFGNFGVAILVFTVIVKACFFPLANKSYHAMAKMKKLQPKMQELRERVGDDKVRLNQEMMALYKREKVSPVSGCLPILIQIPVFFALYKVLFVTIEMRHAPFFGWIHDLSAPDPTTIFNLFGLIPWTPPQMLMLGLWPIIMGITMYFQQKLNPTPPDPVQQKVFQFLPIIFTFMLASFPAGLVIYWAWNNTLSVAQQWIIMRQDGVKA